MDGTMFKYKNKTKGIDYEKLNEGIYAGALLLKIFLILSIVILVYVISKLLSEWQVLPFIGDFLSILSPFFIGIAIAWLFDPIVKNFMQVLLFTLLCISVTKLEIYNFFSC